MRISYRHGYNNVTALFDITASTSHRQSKPSLNIRDSFIFPHLKGLCRSALSKWETRTVKMENDYTCQVCSVNVHSSFGLGMRWCVAIMAPEQWRKEESWMEGGVINCLGVMEAKIGPSPSSQRACLESGWIGSAYKRWMVLPWITHIRLKKHLGRKMVRNKAGVCACAIISHNDCSTLRTSSVQVDNLAHLGSKPELIEKLQMQKENIFLKSIIF